MSVPGSKRGKTEVLWYFIMTVSTRLSQRPRMFFEEKRIIKCHTFQREKVIPNTPVSLPSSGWLAKCWTKSWRDGNSLNPKV